MEDNEREIEREMVEDPEAHSDLTTAHNLSSAASANNSLMGYAAINGLADQDEIARLAYEYFQKREQEGRPGTPDDDWLQAEIEYRSRIS